MKARAVIAAIGVLASIATLGSAMQAQRRPRVFPKHVLAWADVRSGYQHDSISHAV
ncbi:MAG: hypothetical protein JF601_09305, partial [Acidobacteria bacterium]|nr:hypothetical protein [Acidobacteriota bacterium]